jgi:cytochrome P450
VGVNAHAIHHDENIYKKPYEFNPDRWSKEESKNYPKFSWLPFSLGPRVCVGNNFSIQEQKVFLSIILQNFTFKLKDESQEVKTSKTGFLNPAQPMNVIFKKIK